MGAAYRNPVQLHAAGYPNPNPAQEHWWIANHMDGDDISRESFRKLKTFQGLSGSKHERSRPEYCAAAYYLLSEPKSGLGTLVAAGWVAIHTSLRGYRTTHTADAPYKTT